MAKTRRRSSSRRSSTGRRKVAKVMREHKRGKLRSSSGAKVRNPAAAQALIARV